MKDFFKPSDFSDRIRSDSALVFWVAETANAKLNAEILKLQALEGRLHGTIFEPFDFKDRFAKCNPTHIARLLIEEAPRKECLHDGDRLQTIHLEFMGYKCLKCGKKLKAQWSVNE